MGEVLFYLDSFKVISKYSEMPVSYELEVCFAQSVPPPIASIEICLLKLTDFWQEISFHFWLNLYFSMPLIDRQDACFSRSPIYSC